VIILFDGVCNLCSSSVQFIIERDPKHKFKFASLQSPFGQQQLLKWKLDPHHLHSIILIKENTFYQRSNAALEIAKNLKGLWPVIYGFKIIPTFLRDGIYDWIARNRYRWFGKKDACWLPTPEMKSRFIE
jgi:predicted DCC family thiol-disulfide oxidoreductase YuxK